MTAKKTRSNGSLAYLATIRDLRRFIDENDYVDGGWLPAGREMARRLKVSYLTYCKALRFLVGEGIAKSFPSSGHYVVRQEYRSRKIGLIIGNGGASPFVRTDSRASAFPYSSSVSACFDCVARSGFNVQILQATSPEQLIGVAEIYGVEGVLWCEPPTAIAGEVRAMVRLLPTVVITPPKGDFGEHIVRYDVRKANERTAEFVRHRGHTEIVAIKPYESLQESGFVETFASLGGHVTPARCVPVIHRSAGTLVRLITADPSITAVLGNGGPYETDCLFEELATLPADLQPEVILPNFHKLEQVQLRYPGVRVMPIRRGLSSNFGLEAARMLIRHLENGDPLTTLLVGPE